MNEQKKLVPKLRFPEFQKTVDWRIKPFQKLFTIGSGRDYKHLSKGSVPVYGSGGYMLSVDDFLYDGESVCIGRKGTINNPMFLTGKFWTVDTLFYTHSFQQCLPKFIYAIFQNIEWLKHNEAGGVPSLSKTIIEKIQTAVPDIPEQQKIADCLSSLDELIAAQARKVEVLKTHKKGLMQQLFPREGETQPRLRFPEFQNVRDWETKSLGSFSKVGDIDHKMPSSIANGIPYIMTGDFFGINDIDYENAKKISIEDYEQLSKKIKPELGDIVIARYASVGAVRYIQTRLKFLASYSCAIIKCSKSEDSRYIYYALQSDVIQSQIRLEINTSSQKNIGIDSIKKLSIFIPALSEQLKISDCLAVFDAQITAETQQLDALKTHKKGLMQQLFPSSEALES
jgi:type I restriction enzyme S subunit